MYDEQSSILLTKTTSHIQDFAWNTLFLYALYVSKYFIVIDCCIVQQIH